MKTKLKKQQRDRRRKRIRAKVFGAALKPRLSIFRSNRYINAQLIDDAKGETLAAAGSQGMKGQSSLDKAKKVGKIIAGQAKLKNISKVVFDRNGYIYAGSVAALAEGAREAGLEF